MPRDVSATGHPDLSRLLADAAAIVSAASGDNLAAARAGVLVWMDAEEAAAYLNQPLGTFKALAGRGEIPRHKRGAGYRYKREELDRWLLLADRLTPHVVQRRPTEGLRTTAVLPFGFRPAIALPSYAGVVSEHTRSRRIWERRASSS